MESQPQNPEFRNNPENFHVSMAMVHGLSSVQTFKEVYL